MVWAQGKGTKQTDCAIIEIRARGAFLHRDRLVEFWVSEDRVLFHKDTLWGQWRPLLSQGILPPQVRVTSWAYDIRGALLCKRRPDTLEGNEASVIRSLSTKRYPDDSDNSVDALRAVKLAQIYKAYHICLSGGQRHEDLCKPLDQDITNGDSSKSRDCLRGAKNVRPKILRLTRRMSRTGGLSNRQREHKKVMPLAAKRSRAARTRREKKQLRKHADKQFRGKKAWK
ncbi:hypothetical protein KSP40_PGU010317 [Platanthera guangdongensis]|uniref:SDA1 C-terminal domain-containing protein n=1 Tax=Platanthera guangdongensis TaxID=2320717 RepID=A0ABR2N5R5_9ASPA